MLCSNPLTWLKPALTDRSSAVVAGFITGSKAGLKPLQAGRGIQCGLAGADEKQAFTLAANHR